MAAIIHLCKEIHLRLKPQNKRVATPPSHAHRCRAKLRLTLEKQKKKRSGGKTSFTLLPAIQPQNWRLHGLPLLYAWRGSAAGLERG